MRLKGIHTLADGTKRKWLKLMTKEKSDALPSELSRKYRCDIVTIEGYGEITIRVYHSTGCVDTITATPL